MGALAVSTAMKALLLALWLGACSAFAADLSSFNGTWILESAEINGNGIPIETVSHILLILDNGSYKIDSPELRASGTFTVDFSKKPLAMDMLEKDGQNVGRTTHAIVEFTPTGWRANYGLEGGPRPTDFKTSDGSNQLMGVYKRKPGTAPAAPAPIKALLLLGGCCHDYAKQKDILKEGLEARANIKVDIIYSPDGSTKPPLPIYGNPNYAAGYDVVIHDECAADISEPSVIEGVLKPHRDGVAGVNLHCAMHCYRIGNPNEPSKSGTPQAFWFDYLGLQSSGHGPQKPISVAYLDPDHPVTKGLANWTTINEELYNNILIWGDAKALARGKQEAGDRPGRTDSVVVWTHEYGAKKARVFSTTLGHNNGTVSDPRYLDLVTRGLLWSTKHLNDDGSPASGYGPSK